ncbi:MAG: polyprenyl synthetase family protein [Clostridia bacterium]|nr:polyprenyl synthetase family protein [Clostridia bacterium]
MNEVLKKALDKAIEDIDEAITDYLSVGDDDYMVLTESMRYSAISSGKRVRPFLALEFCRLFGGRAYTAMPFACAVEMVHTYSLIHDDLPCMDDDDLRRGKATNHIVYGESTALLAGDALLTLAFETLTEAQLDPGIICEAVKTLAYCSGPNGMIGGQQMDILGEDRKYNLDQLSKMHAKKTGALIYCACTLGALSAGYREGTAEFKAAEDYAGAVGLAFQITDDILDVYGTEQDMGKPIGSDAYNGKTTYISLMSKEEAYELARKLTEQAKEAIGSFENNEVLCLFADYLLERTK